MRRTISGNSIHSSSSKDANEKWDWDYIATIVNKPLDNKGDEFVAFIPSRSEEEVLTDLIDLNLCEIADPVMREELLPSDPLEFLYLVALRSVMLCLPQSAHSAQW